MSLAFEAWDSEAYSFPALEFFSMVHVKTSAVR